MLVGPRAGGPPAVHDVHHRQHAQEEQLPEEGPQQAAQLHQEVPGPGSGPGSGLGPTPAAEPQLQNLCCCCYWTPRRGQQLHHTPGGDQRNWSKRKISRTDGKRSQGERVHTHTQTSCVYVTVVCSSVTYRGLLFTLPLDGANRLIDLFSEARCCQRGTLISRCEMQVNHLPLSLVVSRLLCVWFRVCLGVSPDCG